MMLRQISTRWNKLSKLDYIQLGYNSAFYVPGSILLYDSERSYKLMIKAHLE